MFPNSSNFTIDGSSFQEVNGNVDQSTYITYNIQIAASDKDQFSLLNDKEEWKTIISHLDAVIGKKNATEGDLPDEDAREMGGVHTSCTSGDGESPRFVQLIKRQGTNDQNH